MVQHCAKYMYIYMCMYGTTVTFCIYAYSNLVNCKFILVQYCNADASGKQAMLRSLRLSYDGRQFKTASQATVCGLVAA